jgi:site-specific recombinase XerD
VALQISDWSEEETTFIVNGKGSKERLAFLPDARSVAAISAYLKVRSTSSVATQNRPCMAT